jgi:L-arabinose isomerase
MDKVPTIALEGFTEAQKKAYVIADNKLALNADWDYELLKIEVENIAQDINLSLLGFDNQELANIIDELSENSVDLKEQSYSEIYNIIVSCEDEGHQERVYNELLEKGYSCQVQSL